MHALVPPVAVRAVGLVLLAVAGGLVAAADDHPDANIGLGMLLAGGMLLAVVVWAAVDAVRSARRGRPDREGLLVWLGAALAVGVSLSVGTAVWHVFTEPGPLPVGALLGAPLTYATFAAVPAAVSYGLARSISERRLTRRG